MANYKGMLLHRNSKAYELWSEKDFKKLDQHLKEVEQRHRDLLKSVSDRGTK